LWKTILEKCGKRRGCGKNKTPPILDGGVYPKKLTIFTKLKTKFCNAFKRFYV